MREMNFGQALEALKLGHRVARTGWNDKGMWLALTPGSVIEKRNARAGAARLLAQVRPPDPAGMDIRIGAHIDMKTVDGSLQVGWLASQTDMLAEDWIDLDDGDSPRLIVHDVPTPPDEALSRLEMENAELRRALAESPAAAELIRAAPGALRFRDAEYDALRRASADAIPVLEAAIDFAENNFLGPDGVIDLKAQVIAAVGAFGGTDRIEEMKAMLGSKP